MSRTVRTRTLGTLALALAAAAGAARAQTAYEVIKIEFPGAASHQDRHSAATSVNNRGQVVGYALVNDAGTIAVRPFVWQNGVQRMLPSSIAANPHRVDATDINESGLIVGMETYGEPGGGGGSPGADSARLIVWDANNPAAMPRTFGPSHTVPQAVFEGGVAVNDHGIILGKVHVDFQVPQVPMPGWSTWILDVSTGQFTFLWDPSPLGLNMVGADISNAGMVTGTFTNPLAPIPGLYQTAYRWVGGERIALDPPATAPGAGMFHAGIGLNEQGAVVGASDPSLAGSEPAGAAMWTGTERIWLDPPSLPFGQHLVEAHAINEKGQVVGYGEREGGPLAEEAYLLDNGQVTWLNDIMPAGSGFVSLVRAVAINDEGWIVGTGVTATDPHGVGFILKPLDAPCYPDCNEDGSLNLADFGCFQTRFALGETYADCNGDGKRNLADFGCFQTQFAVGCP